MRLTQLLAAAAVLAGLGCSADPKVICEGTAPVCDTRGYFALCGDPGSNAAVDDSGGLFCVNRPNCTPSANDLCLDYIGPAAEVAPDCSGGQPVACPSGEQPVCVFMPGCRGGEF